MQRLHGKCPDVSCKLSNMPELDSVKWLLHLRILLYDHWHLLCIADCAVNVDCTGIQEGKCVCCPVACASSIEECGIVHKGVVVCWI